MTLFKIVILEITVKLHQDAGLIKNSSNQCGVELIKTQISFLNSETVWQAREVWSDNWVGLDGNWERLLWATTSHHTLLLGLY